jgi:hypothetical protein
VASAGQIRHMAHSVDGLDFLVDVAEADRGLVLCRGRHGGRRWWAENGFDAALSTS